MNVSLRRAKTEDIPLILAIEESVSGTKTYVSLVKESDWEVVLKNEEVYIIMNNGEVVGNISYQRKNDKHVYISGFAIKPEFQDRGLGKRSLEIIFGNLKDLERIDLAVHPENIRAIRLYEKYGFKKESQKENYFGDGEPRLILSREIK